jgi:hypothetical protein
MSQENVERLNRIHEDLFERRIGRDLLAEDVAGLPVEQVE